jgi:hypothetical protein
MRLEWTLIVGFVEFAPAPFRFANSLCSNVQAYVNIRQHASEYFSIRQQTSAYVIIRQNTSAYVSIRQHTSAHVSTCQHTSADVRTRQQTLSLFAYTSAYFSRRQNTSAYVEFACMPHTVIKHHYETRNLSQVSVSYACSLINLKQMILMIKFVTRCITSRHDKNAHHGPDN